MADAHPRWMGSLQGHPEWKRLFPDIRPAGPGQVTKAYPWTPILYREAYAAHLDRVRTLLAAVPKPAGVFLNDLQGVPSACGCGNTLCRWTADYGPLVTATPLQDDAASRFIVDVKQFLPDIRVVPVWATECEAEDKAEACAGVSCFDGACWKAWTRQLMPLAQQAPLIGVLTLDRELGRNRIPSPGQAPWIRRALASFSQMPPKRDGQAIATSRLIAVLQGWGGAEKDIEKTVRDSLDSGVAGYVIARTRIDQSWLPRMVDLE
jgi:hypothetical protein